jgi:hypothetical protein
MGRLRVQLWSIGLLVGFAAVGLIIIVGEGRFVRGLQSYGGITLGETMQSLLYRKGEPAVLLVRARDSYGNMSYLAIFPSFGLGTKQGVPNGKTVMDYDRWAFNQDDKTPEYTVAFRDKKVSEIDCANDNKCPPLLGVRTGTTERNLLSTLGQPTAVETRLYDRYITYSDLGVEFILRQERVYYFKKIPPRAGGSNLWTRYLNHLLHPVTGPSST